jgi:hypothetical protein
MSEESCKDCEHLTRDIQFEEWDCEHPGRPKGRSAANVRGPRPKWCPKRHESETKEAIPVDGQPGGIRYSFLEKLGSVTIWCPCGLKYFVECPPPDSIKLVECPNRCGHGLRIDRSMRVEAAKVGFGTLGSKEP